MFRFWFKEILEKMKQQIEKKRVEKLIFYSVCFFLFIIVIIVLFFKNQSHDSALTSILNGLLNWNYRPYASELVFELLENNKKEYFVRINYNGEALDIGCNKKICSFSEFGSIISDMIPTIEECNV